MLMHTGEAPVHSKHGLITTVAARLGGPDVPATYALEGSVAVAGSLINWLRDNLGIIGDAAEVEALARSVPDSGDVVFVPAFSGLFAPHWRSDARGVIAGLTAVRDEGPHRAGRARVDGVPGVRPGRGDDRGSRHGAPGGTAGRWRDDPQRTADAVPGGHPRSAGRGATIAETSALGAAYAAGLAVGFWGGLDELRAMDSESRRWTPSMDATDPPGRHRRWHKGLERTLGWVE